MSSAFAGDSEPWAAARDRHDLAWRLRVGFGEVRAQRVVDLARDVALEAAHDFELGLSFGGASLRVCAGALAVAQAADGDEVQGAVGLAVATVVEAVTDGLARGGGNGAGAAQRSERALAAESVDVL